MVLFDQAAEGARIAGASRIIGVDLNSKRFDEGESNTYQLNIKCIMKLQIANKYTQKIEYLFTSKLYYEDIDMVLGLNMETDFINKQ